ASPLGQIADAIFVYTSKLLASNSNYVNNGFSGQRAGNCIGHQQTTRRVVSVSQQDDRASTLPGGFCEDVSRCERHRIPDRRRAFFGWRHQTWTSRYAGQRTPTAKIIRQRNLDALKNFVN